MINTDSYGITHFYISNGDVFNAAKQAIEQINKDPKPCFFWFNDTPAPIKSTDTPQTLLERWVTWRAGYQAEPKSLLQKLIQMKDV